MQYSISAVSPKTIFSVSKTNIKKLRLEISRPIAFAAEREAALADQVDNIVIFWQQVCLDSRLSTHCFEKPTQNRCFEAFNFFMC